MAVVVRVVCVQDIQLWAQEHSSGFIMLLW